jgi:flagellar hook-associated protein 2
MIPGITNSGFDTDGMIDEIMEAERAPVTRMEQEIDTYEEEKAAWQEIGRRITNLREASRLLFGFETPFNDRIASSEDESVVIASAIRNAPTGASSISVIQLAQADRFLSRSLPRDFDVAAGRYGFRVADEEVYFTFRGGSLEAFARSINERASDVVSARVVRDTANTQIILIEALATGAENTLTFLEDARAFALEASILEETLDRAVSASILPSTVTSWTTPLASTSVAVQNGTVTIEPGAEASIRMPGAIATDANLVLEMEVWVDDFSTTWTPPAPPPGPTVPDPGEVTLGDVTVENAPSTVPLPDWTPPEPPAIRNDFSFLYAQDGSRTVALPELSDTDGFETIRFEIGNYVDSINAINVRNSNTQRRISIRNVELYDPTSRGDLRPVNAVSSAQDAILEVDGIRVVRPSNSVSDLIEGVTLELRGTSSRPLDINVEPNRESVKNAMIDLVFRYNQLLTEINILTRNEQAVVDEITYFTDDEREEALEQLGMLQGDSTLRNLKSRLQTVMMNAYPTDAGSAMTLLAQIGISTNASGPGGGFDASRLRGYLEINEQQLDAVLAQELGPLRQLFGSDTDSDQVVDTGVAFEIDTLTRPYVQVGGIVATRTGTIDSSIDRTEDRIERENDRLVDREIELRNDFGRMEGALNSLEENQRALENLPTQSGTNSR